MNRETWLQKAVELIRPWFTEAGLVLPATVHVSVGFPSKGALSRKVARLGECWKPQVSADGSPQIYINPTVADGSRALDILVHELIHAALPEAGHNKTFAAAARKLGLDGPPKQTIASDSLRERLQRLIDERLGVYPHPALSPTLQEKKQTTRLIKVVCTTEACKGDAVKDGRYTARITRLWLDKFGAPLCPNCEAQMVADEKQQQEVTADAA